MSEPGEVGGDALMATRPLAAGAEDFIPGMMRHRLGISVCCARGLFRRIKACPFLNTIANPVTVSSNFSFVATKKPRAQPAAVTR